MPPLLPLLLLTCKQSLRGRVAVNSDSVDSEDYYYFPEVEDYEFVEGEDPEDLDDEDMELYVKSGRTYYGPDRGIDKEIKHATRYADNRRRKALQRGDYYGARQAARQANRAARRIARDYDGYGYRNGNPYRYGYGGYVPY
jgi:hypothetical protein